MGSGYTVAILRLYFGTQPVHVPLSVLDSAARRPAPCRRDGARGRGAQKPPSPLSLLPTVLGTSALIGQTGMRLQLVKVDFGMRRPRCWVPSQLNKLPLCPQGRWDETTSAQARCLRMTAAVEPPMPAERPSRSHGVGPDGIRRSGAAFIHGPRPPPSQPGRRWGETCMSSVMHCGHPAVLGNPNEPPAGTRSDACRMC